MDQERGKEGEKGEEGEKGNEGESESRKCLEGLEHS